MVWSDLIDSEQTAHQLSWDLVSNDAKFWLEQVSDNIIISINSILTCFRSTDKQKVFTDQFWDPSIKLLSINVPLSINKLLGLLLARSFDKKSKLFLTVFSLIWWSVVQQLDVFWRKYSYSTSTAPSPGQWARAVQQVDDITAQEVEVGGLRGSIVTEGMSQTRFLHKDRAKPCHQTEQVCV